jgi:LAS superfamily LD-carboxypeptidase LdcB
MPSKLARVQVRLTPEQYEAIAKISKQARLSMSRVVGDIIEPHLPVLRSAAQMLEDAAAMTQEARSALRPMLDANERKVQKAAISAYRILAETEAAMTKARAAEGPAPAGRAAARRKKTRRLSPR